MACGVPCVSFNCNYGPSDIIRNEKDGLLVKKEDIEGLSNKLLLLIENNKLRHEYGRMAKLNVKRFEQNVIAKKWDDLFQNLQNK